MTYKIIHAAAAVIAVILFHAQPAQAAPMTCSGEQKTCLASCPKTANSAVAGACIANCGARQSVCKQTGCWDNGTNRYCGLARQ